MEKFEAAKILRALKKNTEEDAAKNLKTLEQVLCDSDMRLAKKCFDDIEAAMNMAIEALESE